MSRKLFAEEARQSAGLKHIGRFIEAVFSKSSKQLQARPRKGPAAYAVTSISGESFTVVVTGRNRWALERLRAAGFRGCNPANELGPRWSAYVKNLRDQGLEIATVYEKHLGVYPSIRGRYFLLSSVTNKQPLSAVTWFQMLYLCWFFGLSKAQANSIAPLIWGADK